MRRRGKHFLFVLRFLLHKSYYFQAQKTKLIKAWWLRVNVPVEIKPKNDDDITKDIFQLLGYMRQVLREQMDRLFVPGILFSKTELAVWISDRTGVLGTQSSFNIHEVCFAILCCMCAAEFLKESSKVHPSHRRLLTYASRETRVGYHHAPVSPAGY